MGSATIMLLLLLALLGFATGQMILLWAAVGLGAVIFLVKLASGTKKATLGVGKELTLGVREEMASSKPTPPDASLFKEMSGDAGRTVGGLIQDRKVKTAKHGQETNVAESLGQGSKNFLNALKRIFWR